MRKGLSIAGICSGCVVIALVFTMVNTAIPGIRASLDASLGAMQWMMTVFGVVNCAMLVTAGRLADIYGRKKVFLIGLLFCLIAMFFGGFCTRPEELILCMGFAGVGNAILLPVSQALLVKEFAVSQKGRAIGLWAAAIASAMALGPVAGGIIAASFGWAWVFWCNVPVIAVSFFLVFVFSKESKNTEDPPFLDLKGMLYLAFSLSAFVLVATEYRQLSLFTVCTLLFSACIGFSLLWKEERRCPSPIVLAELVGNRVFLAASLASSCLIFYIWSLFFLLPLYLQSVLGQSAFFSGVAMMGITIPVAVLSPLIGKLYRADKAWAWTFFGFLFLCASSFLQSFFSLDTPFSTVFLASLSFGVGYAFITGPTATAALSIVSLEKSGIASGTFITIQEIGGTFGLALIVTLVRSHPELLGGYRQGMTALVFVGLLGCFFSLFMAKRVEACSLEKTL